MAPVSLPATRTITLVKLAPTDVVPRLRSDLKVSADLSTEEGSIHVEDPLTGKAYFLKEVEFSLARMLNGKRTANEVVEAASKLGLPVTIDALTRFLGKLSALGLLAGDAPRPPEVGAGAPDPAGASVIAPEPGTVPSSSSGLGSVTSTWPVRDEWPEPLRNLFQQALRAFRTESFDEATQAIEMFLAELPAVKEAQDLKKRIERMKLAWAGAEPPKTFSQEFTALEATWFAEGESGEWLKNLPVEPPSQLFAPPPPKSKLPLVLFGGLLALGAAALLVPFPYQVQAKASTRAAAPAVKVNAPHAGTVASVEVKEGQWVEKGAVLLKFDPAEANARLAKVKGELKDKEARLKKAKAPSPKGKAAKAAMAKADAAEQKAKADLDAAKAAPKVKKAAVAKAEKKLAQATRAALAARRAFVKATGGDDPEQLQLEVQALTQQAEALTADLAAGTVVAPQAGTVVGLNARAGAALPKDGAVLRLEDARTLAVDLEVKPSDVPLLKVGQEVAVRLGGKKVTAKLTQVSASGVVATLDNSKGDLASGAQGTATISGGARSALGRL